MFYIRHKKPIIVILFLCSLFFLSTHYLTPITSNDFWIQLKIGQLIKENFEIPRTILFAFTEAKDYPFIAHEWLPSLIFSLFYDSFGENFMIIFKLILFICCFLLAYRLSFSTTKKPLPALFISCLVLFTLNYRSFLRPEVFSYIFFFLQLNLLSDFQQKKKKFYLLLYLIVHILWVNSHGSFLVSLGLPILLSIGNISDRVIQNLFDKKKRKLIHKEDLWLILLSGASLVSSLINPYGYKLLVHSYELSQNTLLRSTILEWRPMISKQIMPTPIFAVFLIFSSFFCFIAAFRFMALRSFSLLLLITFTYLTLSAQRHLAFLTIASVWPLSFMLKDLKEKSFISDLLSILLVFTLISLSLRSINHGNIVLKKPGFYNTATIPEDAMNFMKKENLSGNTLNTYKFGGQLLFNFYPQIKIGVDSRIDAYGVEYTRAYKRIIYGPTEILLKFIKKYSIKNIIVDPLALRNLNTRGSLHTLLEEENWKISYNDKKLIIIQKIEDFFR